MFDGETNHAPRGVCLNKAIWGVPMAQDTSKSRQIHWEKTRNLTWLVLVLWFIFSMVIPWFAKELDSFSFLGFELGYYMIVQGSLIVFVLLIVFQNFRQDSIDDEYIRAEGD